MKFGLGMPALILYPPVMSRWEPEATPEEILSIARKADDLGYDCLTIPEHIFIPQEMGETMGPRYPEALAAAACLAGATKRIRLLTYVLVLPYRNPVLLAKQIATMDFLTGGRFTLGTASGHMEKEFEVLKVPMKERGAITDEYIGALKELWTSPNPSFQGRYVQFDNVVFEPRSPQKPHPPILVGGNSKPAMRRAAKLGDGWLPWLVSRKKLAGCLSYIREQPDFGERDRPFEVVMPLAQLNVEDYTHRELGRTKVPRSRDAIVEEIGLLKEAGATTTLVAPPKTPGVEQFIEWTDWFAEEIMPVFKE
jgi:probable F420-dependent oxidoreductase